MWQKPILQMYEVDSNYIPLKPLVVLSVQDTAPNHQNTIHSQYYSVTILHGMDSARHSFCVSHILLNPKDAVLDLDLVPEVDGTHCHVCGQVGDGLCCVTWWIIMLELVFIRW